MMLGHLTSKCHKLGIKIYEFEFFNWDELVVTLGTEFTLDRLIKLEAMRKARKERYKQGIDLFEGNITAKETYQKSSGE